MNECNHYWIPNSGRGGEPDFRLNRMMHPTEPLMHVRCSLCGTRTWVTKEQWAAIPVMSEPEKHAPNAPLSRERSESDSSG